ncbi:MAG: TolC family protein, partial [Desulfobacterales bacterium]|nr:TolC family protein [Desulfobacterales bacterium]
MRPSRTPSDCRAFVRAAGLAAFAALCLAGCMVGPDFQRPGVEMPPAYVGRVPQPIPPPVDPVAASLASWWGLFDDPVLATLVERALRSNLDVKVAETRVRQARAAVQGAQSFLWPAVDSSASVRRSRTPGPVGNRGNVGTLYQAGFDAGWELDLFGGVRRSVEAA